MFLIRKMFRRKTSPTTNKRIKSAIKYYWWQISPSFDPKGQILDFLFSRDILVLEKKKEIEKITSEKDRADALLYHLFAIKNPEAFIIFRDSLKDEAYKWIVDLIDEFVECKGECYEQTIYGPIHNR